MPARWPRSLLAIGLIGALDRAKRQPVMVAVLLTEASVAAAVVHTFADGRVEMLPLQTIDVPEGKALEIWTLWDRAVGPRSVGLIDRARTTPLRLDQLPLGRDQLFEITIEPATGSPTAARPARSSRRERPRRRCEVWKPVSRRRFEAVS